MKHHVDELILGEVELMEAIINSVRGQVCQR